jgi:hypothetical protein
LIDDEALLQIDRHSDGSRPLVICDVDEVLLHFVAPFKAFLKHNGHTLVTSSYRLTGNVFDDATGAPAGQEAVMRLLGGFFEAQHEWQTPVDGALQALNELAEDFDVLLLTAMPHTHRERRANFMTGLGFTMPVLTVESDKGPSVARLARARPSAAFIDDLAHNHHSVAQHHPGARLYQIMAYRDYGEPIPTAPAGVEWHDDWTTLSAAIRRDLG